MAGITPWTLTALTFLLVSLAPALTLLFAAGLLSLYRLALRRHMRTAASPRQRDDDTASPAVPAPQSSAAERPAVDYIQGPRLLALQYTVAGLAFAAVFAVAAPFVYPHHLGVPGYLIGVWIYFWPVPIALALVMPSGWRLRALLFCGYFTVFALLVAWAGTVKDIPALNSAGIVLPARSSATPQLTLRLWFAVAGAPTLLVLLCFNRWVRAVAPLVLAFVTTVLIGLIVVLLAIFTERGIDAFVRFAVATGVHVYWWLLVALGLSLVPLAGFGWMLVRGVARLYQRRLVTDQSLMLDALWLIFASFFGMWLLLGGVAWFAVAPVAFVVYKIVLALSRRIFADRRPAHRGLTFLRVFSLGRRSERLLDSLARYWRHIGSVQQITGPDTARSTVQPHQFLDFLSGRLDSHFVRDSASLDRRLASCDRQRGPDGLYRINSFFCHQDTWQLALPRLADNDETVLMDLRSFSRQNKGCIHELEFLVTHVPLDAFVLLIDAHTDVAFLEDTLAESWRCAPEGANRSRSPAETRRHYFVQGRAAQQTLLRELLA